MSLVIQLKKSLFARGILSSETADHIRVTLDIEVTIKAGQLFERKFAPARLIDITERGASIISNTVLRENKKLLLKFTFDHGQTFIFRARVVRRIKRKGLPYIYGAEFENRDALFKEHLLKTQLRLNLKKHSFSQAADNQPRVNLRSSDID